MKKHLIQLILLLSLIAAAIQAHSEESVGLLMDGEYYAQLDGSDAYDPFVDYSEFDENSDEEADINFFKNGRFFTLGLTVGNRFVTDQLTEIYENSPTFGLFISYFFDLRFAIQMGFVSGSDHNIKIKFPSGQTFTGSSSISSISLNLKYYLNTQNVTRGLAQFNPYLIGGFAQVTRKTQLSEVPNIAEDSAFGFELGGGFELPIMRKRMFLGLQTTYQVVTFSDENTELEAANSEKSGIVPRGDLINLMAILGINF